VAKPRTPRAADLASAQRRTPDLGVRRASWAMRRLATLDNNPGPKPAVCGQTAHTPAADLGVGSKESAGRRRTPGSCSAMRRLATLNNNPGARTVVCGQTAALAGARPPALARAASRAQTVRPWPGERLPD